MRFSCKTYFDITMTGITGHYKSSHIPFKDKSGQLIIDETTWNQARNQQRNWETLQQLISLRTQISKISTPTQANNMWEFDFEVETESVYGDSSNPVALLLTDCANVPMLPGLGTNKNIAPMLITAGAEQNIWFSHLMHK